VKSIVLRHLRRSRMRRVRLRHAPSLHPVCDPKSIVRVAKLRRNARSRGAAADLDLVAPRPAARDSA
jgi:hypothetical protein